jgi:Reverse transcriptase (RNA-dependent DNA polymerase)
MLFRLTNVLVIFQAYINKALLGLLDTIYIVYLNNIIVYSNNYKVYTHYVQIVLERLREYELYINLKKCSFYITSINFLGFIISVNGVLIEKSQVDTIREWPYPITFREV